MPPFYQVPFPFYSTFLNLPLGRVSLFIPAGCLACHDDTPAIKE